MMFLYLLVMTALKGTFALRFKYLGVPGSVLRGDPVWLDCGYDLEEDVLYSVKWYKDNYEFYRFLPYEHPPSQTFTLTGVDLDVEKSNATHAYLRTVNMDTEGVYACEVSTDAPSFRTIKAEKKLRVHVVPDSEPVIYGFTNEYHTDEMVNVTCSFGPSKPAAKIEWHINEELVRSSYETKHVTWSSGVAKVESRLRFPPSPGHLWQGTLRLRCTARMFLVFSESSEEIIILGDTPTGSEFQRLTQVAPGQEPPRVTAGMSSYSYGDLVDVNCTSARSIYPAELKWSINDEEAENECLQEYPPLMYNDGLVSARLGLKFRIATDHFNREEIRLRCTATLAKVVELTTVRNIYSGSHRSLELFSMSHAGRTEMPLEAVLLLGILQIAKCLSLEEFPLR